VTIFYTSDSHFYHKNIMKHCNRPYADVEAMNEDLIKKWNSVVGFQDTVYHLGDFSFRFNEDLRHIFDRLNGLYLHFIDGNHDNRRVTELPWNTQQQYAEVTDYVDGKKHHVVLMHYPIQEWNGQHHGSIHLHGHIHSTPEYSSCHKISNRFDVGVDMRGGYPVTLKQLLDEQGGVLPSVTHHA
jgi:calcineurin-like phosphoesterase family protein